MQNRSHDLGEVFFALCKRVDTPLALGAWLRFKAGEFDQLAELSLRPQDYDNAHDFSKDYLIASFLKKNDVLVGSVDRKAVALAKFIASEEHCKAVNDRFRTMRVRPHWDAHAGHIHVARGKIAKVLGPLTLAKTVSRRRWGPGATLDLCRRRATVDKKITTYPMTVTLGSLPFIRAEIETDPLWFEAFTGCQLEGPACLLPSAFQIVDGCRVVTVPKDLRGDRTIAIEPTGNSFLQQGIGRYIRKRLRSFGVDLDDQSINQTWAGMAQELGLCTLDLSSASDTVSRELVFELLPLDWALHLDSLRSGAACFPDGTSHNLEKFSSMGNAFTFELESLIFWALCKSVCPSPEVVSIYGDDIIVPADRASDVVSLLNHAGFKVNSEKSFFSGRFYESCGRHYYDGFDVTPVFQKHECTSKSELIRCHNRLYRWGMRSGFQVALDPVVESALRLLIRRGEAVTCGKGGRLPLTACRIGVFDEGDDGFISPLGSSQFRWRVRTSEVPGHPVAMYSQSLRGLHGASMLRDELVGRLPPYLLVGWAASIPDGSLPLRDCITRRDEERWGLVDLRPRKRMKNRDRVSLRLG